MLYISACIVVVFRLRQRLIELLTGPNTDFRRKSQIAIALLWECHGRIWHGYEVVGLENIPSKGRALVVYYHGAIPVDYYYLNAKFLLHYKRLMHSVAATFLFKTPGLKPLLDAVKSLPGSVPTIAELLNDEEIVSVAPGGIREAQFSTSSNYELIWNGHLGFAKAACLGKAPIIPVFTQNIREAYRTFPFFQSTFRNIYERTKLPLLWIFGGFPVKLKTFVGKPIPYDEDATPEMVAKRTNDVIKALIKEHQRLPGSIRSALVDRFN